MTNDKTTETQPEPANYSPHSQPSNTPWYILGAVVATLLVGGLGYAAGSSHSTRTDKPGMRGEFGGRMMSGQRPTVGTVAGIDGTTLKVTDRRDGTITVDLSKSPTVYGTNDAIAALGDIKTGDTVAITGTTSDGTVTAKTVRINPTMGKRQAPMQDDDAPAQP